MSNSLGAAEAEFKRAVDKNSAARRTERIVIIQGDDGKYTVKQSGKKTDPLDREKVALQVASLLEGLDPYTPMKSERIEAAKADLKRAKEKYEEALRAEGRGRFDHSWGYVGAAPFADPLLVELRTRGF